MNCPVCAGRSVGKVGPGQYYCWDCFVEFNERNQVFQVAEDGSLVGSADQETSIEVR